MTSTMEHSDICPCSECVTKRKEQAEQAKQKPTEQPAEEFVMERPSNTPVPAKKSKNIQDLNDKYEWLNKRVTALENERDEKAKPKRKKAFWKAWEFYLVAIGVPVFLYGIYLVWQVIEHGKKIVLPW